MNYDDTNTGVLFQNDKDGNEKRPDYKGKLNVEGREFEIAGWKRLSKKNQPFLSIKISEPRKSGYDSFQQAGQSLKKDEVAAEDKMFDGNGEVNLDDIPF